MEFRTLRGLQKTTPFFRRWPFSLVLPTVYFTALTNFTLFAIFIIVNFIPGTPGWLSFIIAGIYYLHFIGILISFALEAYAYEDHFKDDRKGYKVVIMMFIFFVTLSANALMYASLEKTHPRSFEELHERDTEFERLFQTFLTAVDVATTLGPGVEAKTHIAQVFVRIHALEQFFVVLFLFGAVTGSMNF